jgi:ribonuclease HI
MAKKRMSQTMLPVMPDEFQRGPEAGPYVRSAPMSREEMNITPEQERRMRQQVEDERMMREMDKAYEAAPRRSMRYAKGGSVSSASARADGCAQRGKTVGRMV